MPQRHFNIGSSLGDALSGAFSDDAYNKGVNEGSNLTYRREAARKLAAETNQLQQFQDPAQRSELVAGMLGLGKNEAGQLAAFGRDGNWGSGVFMRADPDLEMVRADPAMPSAPDALFPQMQPDSALAEVLQKLNTPKDVVLPNAAPAWGDTAIRLNALVRGAGDKVMTPQTLPALLAQAAAAKAIESGDMTALNVYNTLAREGATYTPYKTDTHGRTTNEGSGAVEVTDKPLHDANIGKLVADAIQSRASAASSNAQAAKHKFDMENPRAGTNLQFSEISNALADVSVNDLGIRTVIPNRAREVEFMAFMKNGGYKNSDQALLDFMQAEANPIVESPAQRFANDPSMKGNKTGKMVDGKGIEVFNASGKLIGHYK